MKTSCPACGAVSSLDVLIGHEGARDAVIVSLQLPAPLGNLLVQYLALFRPPKRNLSMDRVASLLCELKPMVGDARIKRNGQTHSAPLEYWQRGIEDMLARRDALSLPLKNHAYLLTIIAGYSAKDDARKEQQHEDKLAGRTPVGAKFIAPRDEGAMNRGRDESRPYGGRTPMPESVKSVLQRKRSEP